MDRLMTREALTVCPSCSRRGMTVTEGPASCFSLTNHDLIVEPCHLAEGFLSDKADRDRQGFRNTLKQAHVQPGMGTDSTVLVLQKVGGERGVGDQIASCFVENHIGKMGNSLFYQLKADWERNQGRVLRDDEQVEKAAGRGSFSSRY